MRELPAGVQLVAAAKTRTVEEIKEAVGAGIRIIGENYVQEAEKVRDAFGSDVKWHFIGSLQKNKVKKAVELFDMIETVDSFELASEINKRCAAAGRTMDVLIEVNSGSEDQKSGADPVSVRSLAENIARLPNVKIMGLMTMGPFSEEPEDARPYFRSTRKLFEEIKNSNIPGVEMRYLSMGMTASYRVAIEEGANMIRIGTKIFGERALKNRTDGK